MAIGTGKYPVQGRLILTPTNYASGGTDLGLVESSHIVAVNMDTEQLTEHGTGSAVVDTRILGMNATWLIHMSEISAELQNLMYNKVNSSFNVEGFTSYNVGDILSASQTHKLLIRPVDDAGAHDATKPTLYMSRAVVTPAANLIWDRRLSHLSGAAMAITGQWDTARDSAFSYGDSTTLTAI